MEEYEEKANICMINNLIKKKNYGYWYNVFFLHNVENLTERNGIICINGFLKFAKINFFIYFHYY